MPAASDMEESLTQLLQPLQRPRQVISALVGVNSNFPLLQLCSALLWLFGVSVQAVPRACVAVVLPEGLVQLVQFRNQG